MLPYLHRFNAFTRLLSLPTARGHRSIANLCYSLRGTRTQSIPSELRTASYHLTRASRDISSLLSPVMTDHSPKRRKVCEDISADVSKKDEQRLKQCFIGSIDQGTTSSRFFIFDGTGTPVASHQIEFKQMYPHSG